MKLFKRACNALGILLLIACAYAIGMMTFFSYTVDDTVHWGCLAFATGITSTLLLWIGDEE